MTVGLLIGIGAAAIVLFVASRVFGAWVKFRGARVIACPENHRPAGVLVDASHAAATALGSSPQLRLSSCTRWPEKQNCGQECLRQIEAAPEDCLIRNILVRWYAGKDCALCGKPVGPVAAIDLKPAVLLAGGATAGWADLAPETLEETLASGMPVCSACHEATSFAREHPELIVNRSRPA
jgi:hypothetical protein